MHRKKEEYEPWTARVEHPEYFHYPLEFRNNMRIAASKGK